MGVDSNSDAAGLAGRLELSRGGCDATALSHIVRGCTNWLGQHTDHVNSLNVYPVPDGDTGTNMYLTLRAGVDELSATTGNDLSEAVRALAHGTLMGARGNSGVILS